MTTLEAYRDPVAAHRLLDAIRQRARGSLTIMEFCGGHTHAIMRYGLRQALRPLVQMRAGPGCPVCVTADADIDAAIALAQQPGVIVATFGDMLRVPGTHLSLQAAHARGADVRMVYSALDALGLAERNPSKSVVMLGIGFETTAPTVAATLVQAQERGLRNYYVYSVHKLTPPAMRAILNAGEVRVDGVLGPGHVTAIVGTHAWDFLANDYHVPCAVAGFEPVDILQAVYLLVDALQTRQPRVDNPYARGVTPQGNRVAQEIMARVFEVSDAAWRGLGVIPASGLALRPAFAAHDARLAFDVPAAGPSGAPGSHTAGCRCGDVLRGVLEPPDCPLYSRICTPAHPIGPCMVSAEGACAAYLRYGGDLT
jgi:hydrogenase expression/formation protein HypD